MDSQDNIAKKLELLVEAIEEGASVLFLDDYVVDEAVIERDENGAPVFIFNAGELEAETSFEFNKESITEIHFVSDGQITVADEFKRHHITILAKADNLVSRLGEEAKEIDSASPAGPR